MLINHDQPPKRQAGIAVSPQAIIDAFKPGHHAGYTINANNVPKDAQFVNGDFDVVTGELILSFTSPSLQEMGCYESIAFPRIAVQPDKAKELQDALA